MQPSYFPASYSTLSSDALAAFIQERYALENPVVQFFLRGVGDTYMVTETNNRYALRVYRADQRSKAQVDAEVELLLTAQRTGISVSAPIADKEGNFIQEIHAIEGERSIVLFNYAEGEPVGMMSEQQLKEVGREMARLHDICAKIELPEVRWNFDNKTCFDEPLEKIKNSFGKDPEGWEWLEKYSTRAKEVLDSIDSSKFSKGYCHYDFLPKNFHFTTDGRVTFFDFDFFGYGWLINDVMTFWQHFCMLVDAGRMTQKDADRNFNVFVEAYRETRPLSDGELSVMPWLGLGWWIFYLGFYPTHDQFFPIIQPAHLKARMTMMRRLTERYVN